MPAPDGLLIIKFQANGFQINKSQKFCVKFVGIFVFGIKFMQIKIIFICFLLDIVEKTSIYC